MLIVTHRPEYVPEWKTHAALTQLYLGRLDDPQAAEIVRARAGGALPVELEQRILRRGEGNPLFLEELTRALDDEGLLVRRNGEVELTRPVDEVRIPDTLQELLAGCGESDCLKGGPSDERAHEPRGGARSPVRTGLGFR